MNNIITLDKLKEIRNDALANREKKFSEDIKKLLPVVEEALIKAAKECKDSITISTTFYNDDYINYIVKYFSNLKYNVTYSSLARVIIINF